MNKKLFERVLDLAGQTSLKEDEDENNPVNKLVKKVLNAYKDIELDKGVTNIRTVASHQAEWSDLGSIRKDDVVRKVWKILHPDEKLPEKL